QVVLTQAEQSVQGTPGGSLKLTCACSGFTLSRLEWIIYYHSVTYKSNAPVVQGRFTASKDSSSFYLHMSLLKPEYSAVYYCARDSLWLN
uniref:Ig-like domain-containing protein n=1 Tax=Hucho hucho TaxID=62062 RepID=A0A4W5K7R4_9TELE